MTFGLFLIFHQLECCHRCWQTVKSNAYIFKNISRKKRFSCCQKVSKWNTGEKERVLIKRRERKKKEEVKWKGNKKNVERKNSWCKGSRANWRKGEGGRGRGQEPVWTSVGRLSGLYTPPHLHPSLLTLLSSFLWLRLAPLFLMALCRDTFCHRINSSRKCKRIWSRKQARMLTEKSLFCLFCFFPLSALLTC